MVLDLWRVQILLIILWREFTKLNVRTVIYFWNTKVPMTFLIDYKCLSCNKILLKKDL